MGMMITGNVISLKRKGVPVNSNKKKGAFVKFFLYPIFLLTLILLIFELVKLAFQISFSVLPDFLINNFIDSIILKISGTILIIVSFIFMALTLRSFKNSLRFGMDSNNIGKLITTGVFSISRNPFFVSIELYFTGIALLFPSPFFVAFTILTLVSIHFFILKEEKFLQEKYKGKYENYAEKVGRYF